MALLQRIQHIPTPWLVTLILIGSFILLSLKQGEEPQINQYAANNFPQFYMKSVETKEFDAQGTLRYHLTTPYVAHYQLLPDTSSNEDYTHIEQPDMHFQNSSDDAPWLVTANTGRSELGGQLVRLVGDVIIQQQNQTRGLLRVTTSELNIRKNEQFAETDKAVNILSAKGTMTALGMEADLTKSWLELKSQVKAVYEPH